MAAVRRIWPPKWLVPRPERESAPSGHPNPDAAQAIQGPRPAPRARKADSALILPPKESGESDRKARLSPSLWPISVVDSGP